MKAMLNSIPDAIVVGASLGYGGQVVEPGCLQALVSPTLLPPTEQGKYLLWMPIRLMSGANT